MLGKYDVITLDDGTAICFHGDHVVYEARRSDTWGDGMHMTCSICPSRLTLYSDYLSMLPAPWYFAPGERDEFVGRSGKGDTARIFHISDQPIRDALSGVWRTDRQDGSPDLAEQAIQNQVE